MKRANAQFPIDEEERSPVWRAIAAAANAAPYVIVAVAVLCAIFVVLSGCSAEWNKPHAEIPDPGNPCLYVDWHSCGNGICCYVTDECRPGGYCAFGGLIGPTWGAVPDAGPSPTALYHGLTPDQVRRQQVAP